ncbi:U3 snoRNP protein Utp20 [Rhizoctonia solani]|uniref:U3 snoRNP protein Utp20 n=1 Tax=Rhizoctonia solani TaxID=456999 RepID=A0A8H8P4B7_9AGAM|nr:U3 snoRNP protein Utp20 [Rhizoctonia solani]QRW25279.1 U3 snoRNP protein Utp20 [Rhizoctonia solani]
MSVVIGNTLYSQDGHVVTLGLKAAASIVKCPLRSVEKSLPVFVKQTLEIIRSSGELNQVTQTALKSLAIMIRDCPAAKLQESDLTFLLEVIAPDLEEPERQAAVFSLLRTIISVQELARSVLLQFLLDYPQGKGRLRTQLNALARNLDYVFDSGRKSVMEFLAAVISKFTDSIVDEYADMFFVALVLRIANDDSTKCREMAAALIQQLLSRVEIANDDSTKCREMAAALIQQLLSRVGEERRKKLMAHAHNWAGQEEKQQLAGVAAQRIQLNNESDAMDVDEDDKSATWQVPYHALTTLGKLIASFRNSITASTKDWASIYSHLLFPHAWVRLASCRLVGSLFASIPISVETLTLGADLAEATITSPAGTTITLALVDVTQKLCLQLRSTNLDDTLSTQVVKNLFYAGKVFALVYGTANPLAWMFSKLSYQARSAHIARINRAANSSKWYIHIGSIFRWFAAMTSHLSAPTLETFLPHILAPVYRIAEEETIKDTELDDLKTLTHELQALLQQRTGTTAFANAYSRIRQGVVRVRRERKIQRATQAATHPEAAARRRLQRNITKKEGKKRKDRAFADAKIRNNAVKKRRRVGEEDA